MISPREDGAPRALVRTLLCGLACAAIGYALERCDGSFDWNALLAVGVAWLLLAIAALGPRALDAFGAGGKLLGEPGVRSILTALVLLQLVLQFVRPPGLDLQPLRFGPWPYWGGLMVAIATIVLGLFPIPGFAKARWPLLLAVHLGLCTWMLHASPAPQIDVFLFHRAGFAALLEGHSPYATSIPLLYGDARFYGAGLVRDGIVHAGFPYPPLSFALTFLAWFAAGDYRYALAIALTFSAWCIAKLGSEDGDPSAVSELCALLFLFSPRVFFVLEQGWTEPLVIAFACAFVLSTQRLPRAAPWLLAGLVAIKQYGFLFLAPLPILFPLEKKRRLLQLALFACAVALAATLPLALTAPRAFLDSALLLHLRQPFRGDELSFPAALFQLGGPALPGWVSFAVLPLFLAPALRLAPRSAGGFLASCALLFAAFFELGKQAAANDQFLVLALAAAAASSLLNRAASPRLTGARAAD